MLAGRYAVAQEMIISLDEAIVDINIGEDGRLYVLNSNEICRYQDYNNLGDCVTLGTKAEQILPLSGERYLLLAGETISNYEGRSLLRIDTLPDLIFSAFAYQEQIFIGTASGAYSYSVENGDLALLGSANRYVNDVIVVGNKLVMAVEDDIIISELSGEVTKVINVGRIVRKIVSSARGIAAWVETDQIQFFTLEGSNSSSWLSENGAILDLESRDGRAYVLTSNGVSEVDPAKQTQLLQGSFGKMLLLDHSLVLVQDLNVYQYNLLAKAIFIEEPVYSVYTDSINSFWTGHKGSIRHYSDRLLQREFDLPGFAEESFVSTIAVSEEMVFAGTMGQGVFVFTKDGRFLTRLASLKANNQSNIIQLKVLGSHLWIAYLNGVIRVSLDNLADAKFYDDVIGSSYLYCIEPTSSESFYMGTSNDGVIFYENGKVTHVLEAQSVFSLDVAGNVLFIGTERAEVIKLDKQGREHNARHFPLNATA